MRDGRFFAAWIGSSVVAGVVAVAAASLMGAESASAILAVALLEGACLGLLQQAVLHGTRAGGGHEWLYATILGILAGRGLQFAIDASPLLALSYRWPSVVQFLAAALAGATVGAVAGLPQVAVLRRRVPAAGAWLAGRSAGGAAAFTSLLAAQHALGAVETSPIAVVTIVLAVFGLAGGIAGAIEASVLARLLHGPSAGRPRLTAVS